MRAPIRAAVVVVALGVVWTPDTLTARGPQQPSASGTQPRTIVPAPARRTGEGRGPFKTLAIRGVMVIDGTGAPPVGPVDIIVVATASRAIVSAGTPGFPLRPNRPPQNADHEIDATGMYLMPGFVNLHVHAGRAAEERRRRVRLQAVDGARRHHGHAASRSPNRRSRCQRESAQRARTRSSRRASSTTSGPAPGGTSGASTRPKKRASGCAGARPTASTA